MTETSKSGLSVGDREITRLVSPQTTMLTGLSNVILL
jgi:hypothetical protein